MAIAKANPRSTSRSGFTLMELVFTITVIVVLMALTFLFIGGAVRRSRVATEQLFIGNLRLGVEQFKQSFGFYPPLVGAALGNRAGLWGPGRTLTTDPGQASLFLSETDHPGRYSEFSLPLYLLGTGPLILDGYAGAGQGRPREDGTWDVASPKIEPFIDVSRDAERLTPFQGFSTFRDRWGGAIRYYRWEPTLEPKYLDGGVLNPAVGEIKSHNIPSVVFDSIQQGSLFTNNAGAGNRSGTFAIISAGPDGLIADGPWSSNDRDPVLSTQPKGFNQDNIVEVGR